MKRTYRAVQCPPPRDVTIQASPGEDSFPLRLHHKSSLALNDRGNAICLKAKAGLATTPLTAMGVDHTPQRPKLYSKLIHQTSTVPLYIPKPPTKNTNPQNTKPVNATPYAVYFYARTRIVQGETQSWPWEEIRKEKKEKKLTLNTPYFPPEA